MKVIYIYGNIINCEEIRNVVKTHAVVRVYFKGNSEHNEYVDIWCHSKSDADDVADLIFNEMTAK